MPCLEQRKSVGHSRARCVSYPTFLPIFPSRSELNSATRRVLREMKHKKLVKKSKYSKRARQILKNQGSKKKRKL